MLNQDEKTVMKRKFTRTKKNTLEIFSFFICLFCFIFLPLYETLSCKAEKKEGSKAVKFFHLKKRAFKHLKKRKKMKETEGEKTELFN